MRHNIALVKFHETFYFASFEVQLIASIARLNDSEAYFAHTDTPMLKQIHIIHNYTYSREFLQDSFKVICRD